MLNEPLLPCHLTQLITDIIILINKLIQYTKIIKLPTYYKREDEGREQEEWGEMSEVYMYEFVIRM